VSGDGGESQSARCKQRSDSHVLHGQSFQWELVGEEYLR
jgi:hypothetical protein